jgi:hypothetical protein
MPTTFRTGPGEIVAGDTLKKQLIIRVYTPIHKSFCVEVIRHQVLRRVGF